MSYRKPILTEIFAELYLEPKTLDPSGFFDVVPALKQIGLTHVELGDLATSVGAAQMLIDTRTPRVRCWSEDRQRLVQLGPDLVVINQVGKYLGWEAFRSLFVGTKAVLQAQSVLRVRRLALNTLDQARFPAAGFVLGAYVHCGGPLISPWFRDTSVPLDIIYGKGDVNTDASNRQLQLSVHRDGSEMVLRVLSAFNDRVDQPGDLEAKLERLHDESNESFENLITDRVRDLMGGSV